MPPVRLLCLAVATALPAAALADQPAAEEARIERMDTVVVTGVAPSSPLTFVTDPKQPRQPVPASDAADYLKTIPGFAAIRSGGSNGDPVLRGQSGSRLSLLVNGGAMLGACPARMDAPSSYIAPQNFDALTVIKGPQTVLWGPVASAGTVLFERETERFDTPGVRAQGSALVGSFGRNEQTLDVAAGGPAAYARLNANRSEQDDYEDGDGETVPSLWRKWNADAAFGVTPDADTRIELSAGAGDGKARYAGRGMDGTRFRRESLGLRIEKQNVGGVLDAVDARAYYNHADHIMDNYGLREPDPTGPMPTAMLAAVDRRTVGARVAATFRWDATELATGVDAERSDHRNGTAMLPGMANGWDPDARFSRVGVFGEARVALSAQDRLVAGARIDRAAVADRRATVGGMDMGGDDGMGGGMDMGMDDGMAMAMPNPTAGRRREDTLTAGFLRIEHALAGTPVQVHAGVGRSERMPDYWELFSPTLGPEGAVNAFAAVRPETTTQLDLGLTYRSARAEAWVSAYAGRQDDFILFDYLAGGAMGDTTRARNVDADIRGGELGGSMRLGAAWTVDGSLAYAWAGNRDDGEALPQIPPLEARLGVAWARGPWSAGAQVRGVRAQDRVATGRGNVVGRDLGPSKGFAVTSANAAWRVDARWTLAAGIDNLFDRRYAEHLNLAGDAGFGYPAEPVRIGEPGRTLWARVDFGY
ncbi:TonB-dependent copper receptor [Coralloluteibacterium stylophorae]|uniref:TonB-dependent copper receptor n=1 Tax=Coralloluteibacterium stylophorae TaxID=1776034 RepID=A0A8J7VQL3_9GAMM|nr:TonB-dependent copper receptor [Coralloluteibacterium stylophorae]MBS7458102.1 TonB-dependent copper receptor [Coralloluteibacterium stylophorae]